METGLWPSLFSYLQGLASTFPKDLRLVGILHSMSEISASDHGEHEGWAVPLTGSKSLTLDEVQLVVLLCVEQFVQFRVSDELRFSFTDVLMGLWPMCRQGQCPSIT